MRTARILLGLGVWIALLPFLGFPYSWKMILVTLSGLGLAYISYAMYQEEKRKAEPDNEYDNFKENGKRYKRLVRHSVRSIPLEEEALPAESAEENTAVAENQENQ